MSAAQALDDRVDALPFDLAPRVPAARRAGALCVHGLTATPAEVRPVAEALADRGVRAVGPMLPGHGTTPEQLAALSYEAWLAATIEALDALRAECEVVFLVGSSLGGLLSLAAAAEREVAAVATVGAPLDFGWRSWLPGALRHVVPNLPKRGGADIRDAAARSRHVSYPVMPLAAVHQLIRLQGVVRRSFPRIQAPILVAHGRHDRTANPADAATIAEGVGSAEREVLYFEESGHIVTLDHDAEALCGAIVEFFVRRL